MNSNLDNYSPMSYRITTQDGMQFAAIPDGIDAKAVSVIANQINEAIEDSTTRTLRFPISESSIVKTKISHMEPYKPQKPSDLLPGEIWLKYDPGMNYFDMYVGCPFGYTSKYGETKINILSNSKWDIDDNTIKMLNEYSVIKRNIVRLAEKYSKHITMPDVLK